MSGFAIDTGDTGGSGGTLTEDDSTDDLYDDSDTSTSDDSGGSTGGVDYTDEYDDPRNDADNWDGESPEEDTEETTWGDIEFSDGDDGGSLGIVAGDEDQANYQVPDDLIPADGMTLRETVAEYLGVSPESIASVSLMKLQALREAAENFNTAGTDAAREAARAEFSRLANEILTVANQHQAPTEETGDSGGSSTSTATLAAGALTLGFVAWRRRG